MNIIVINAAPRMEAGNTQAVLNPFLVGARQEGAKLDIVLLGRKKINQCLGCFTCYASTPGECVHDDDMPALVAKITAADIMILATPVYLDGMTSLAKTFVDRLVIFLDPHFEQTENGLHHPLRMAFPKKLFLISVCGYPGLSNFEPLVLHTQRIAKNLHSQFAGALLRPAVFSILLGKKYPDRVKNVMDAMRIAGGELVRNGGVSEQTLATASGDICTVEELMKTANSYWDRELASQPRLW